MTDVGADGLACAAGLHPFDVRASASIDLALRRGDFIDVALWHLIAPAQRQLDHLLAVRRASQRKEPLP